MKCRTPSSTDCLRLLKTPKDRERLEIFAPPPYRRGHDHDSFHRRFHTRLPASSPRLLGTRAHRAATSGECPAAAAHRSDLALLHGPTSLGLALPGLAAVRRACQADGARPCHGQLTFASSNRPAIPEPTPKAIGAQSRLGRFASIRIHRTALSSAVLRRTAEMFTLLGIQTKALQSGNLSKSFMWRSANGSQSPP